MVGPPDPFPPYVKDTGTNNVESDQEAWRNTNNVDENIKIYLLRLIISVIFRPHAGVGIDPHTIALD